jgi:4-amino-4-deoxy-L-arabinose transferase-like glycosyltransferase
MSAPLPRRSVAVLLVLVAALLVFRLGAVPLLGPDEPRYTRVAVEMHRAGEWVTPTLQGRPWLEKTPLYYWLAGGFFSVLGETETAARLPSVLAALLLVGVTALAGSRLFGPRAGLSAGFVAGTSLLPFVYGRAASMDMLLAATVTAAIAAVGLRLLDGAGPRAVPVAAAFAGLATLAKGPLGLLLPLLVVGAYVGIAREWSGLREILAPRAILAFLVVAAPWYVAILLDQGRHFFDVFLLNQNVERFTSTIHHHPGAIWYYLPVLLVGLFPWSGLAVPGLFGLRPRTERKPRRRRSSPGSKSPSGARPCLPPSGRCSSSSSSGGGWTPTPRGPCGGSASAPRDCSSSSPSPCRPSSPTASPVARSSFPPADTRSSRGGRGGRPGWPATSTTTPTSASCGTPPRCWRRPVASRPSCSPDLPSASA